jgi:DNA-binding CsgD family transcriptional regulator
VGEEEHVVLSAVVDGVRYTLTECAAQAPAERVDLSAREQEIARMVARGYTNKMIAAVLEISTWTVDTYLRRIFSKLNVRSRSAMVTRLTHEGTLDSADGTPEWREAWQAHVDRNGNGQPPVATTRAGGAPGVGARRRAARTA